MSSKTMAARQEDSIAGKAGSIPERIKSFLNEVRNEMRKVTYPSRREVQATTVVVIVTVFLFGVYFFGVDKVFGFAIDNLLKWAKSL